MYVTIPNAENFQFHRGLFIAAWKVWFMRFSDEPQNWREGRMPVGESDHGLATMLEEGDRFTLEVICRLMVPWNYRDKQVADSSFLHVNTDLLRTVPYTNAEGETVQGVRLADQAIDMWVELTYIERDIFMIFAEARIQADIESTSSAPIVIDDAGIDLIGEDIYPPLVPEKADGQDAYIEALAAWIQEDPFQPLYHRKPVGNPVSGWDQRLEATFWPKPRAGFVVLNHLTNPLLYRCRLLGKGLYEGKKWGYKDKIMAKKTAKEIFLLFGLPQRDFTAEDVEEVFRAAIFEETDSNAKMNSGWTKVAAYATAFFEEYPDKTPHVSWNSRVATSIISRLDFLLVEAGIDNPAELFPNIGTIPGWGGTRPREYSLQWPDTYRKWDGQLAASRLVAKLRDHLNNATNDDGSKRYPAMPIPGASPGLWTVRGVQQVLSADGY